MDKFCKVIEDPEAGQILLRVASREDSVVDVDLSIAFIYEGKLVEEFFGPMPVPTAILLLNDLDDEKIFEVRKNLIEDVNKLNLGHIQKVFLN